MTGGSRTSRLAVTVPQLALAQVFDRPAPGLVTCTRA